MVGRTVGGGGAFRVMWTGVYNRVLLLTSPGSLYAD
ncbi:hypothetical protein KGM_205528 [Danaus plexippus plexippus]|uniref:Uncharacterized protein n=1 Tax=Danaus plexippus plexippus TaxID=278856 RepID=A0A212F5M8_DANPL|nr:hypothetical protein KGM_205528 [Danaus plexippus plexippus]